MGSHSKKAVEQPVRRSHWSVHSWLLPPTPSPTSSPPLLTPSSHISGDMAAPDVSSLLAFAPLLKLSKMPLARFFLCWGKGRKRGERGRGRKKERKKEGSHFLPLWTTFLTGDSASLGSLVPSPLLPHVLLHKRVLIRGPTATIWKCCAHA